MKIYKLAQICIICLVLSGCSTHSSQTEEPSPAKGLRVINDEPVELDITQVKTEEERIPITRGDMIDAQIISPIGESHTYFTTYGDSKVKVYLLNTGTESFLYKIRNADDKKVAAGILKMNESFEQVFTDLPEGDYFISCIVQDEEPPIDIALSVKVEFVE